MLNWNRTLEYDNGWLYVEKKAVNAIARFGAYALWWNFFVRPEAGGFMLDIGLEGLFQCSYIDKIEDKIQVNSVFYFINKNL